MLNRTGIEMALATSEFAESIAALSQADLSKQLCHALERLADIGRRGRDVHEENAKSDVRTIMTTCEPSPLVLLDRRDCVADMFLSSGDEYIRLIASVRVSFNTPRHLDRFLQYSLWIFPFFSWHSPLASRSTSPGRPSRPMPAVCAPPSRGIAPPTAFRKNAWAWRSRSSQRFVSPPLSHALRSRPDGEEQHRRRGEARRPRASSSRCRGCARASTSGSRRSGSRTSRRAWRNSWKG